MDGKTKIRDEILFLWRLGFYFRSCKWMLLSLACFGGRRVITLLLDPVFLNVLHLTLLEHNP